MGRTLAIVGIVLFGDMLSANAQTQSGQWCAYFTGGPTNCGFATFEECLQAIKGKTGLCNQNQQSQQSAPPSDDRTAPVHHLRHRLHHGHHRRQTPSVAQ
jgi:hypothetical protein